MRGEVTRSLLVVRHPDRPKTLNGLAESTYLLVAGYPDQKTKKMMTEWSSLR
jgi:hypothetical protein